MVSLTTVVSLINESFIFKKSDDSSFVRIVAVSSVVPVVGIAV